jgi:hypothetical protein
VSCSGLHCAGCAGGMSVPIVPLLALYGATWVAEHLVEVVSISAICGALAVAAVVALIRWCDRREARRAAASRSLWTARAEAVGPQAAAALPRQQQPAIGDVHIHFRGLPDAEQAHAIRKALNGGN